MATTGILSRYEDEAIPPSPDMSSDYRLQWCMTGMLEGEQFLRNQPLYENIGKTRDYLLGFKDTFRGALGLSDINVNELWRCYNLLAGDWTDINPVWRYESKNYKYQRQARILSDLASMNYTRSGSDGQVNMMARQSLESGSGVLQVMWDRQKMDLTLKSCNPDDVLPIRPNDPDSYQGCLAVAWRREVTVNYAKALFPPYAEYIKMDRDASISGWGMKHRDVLRNRIASVSAFDIVDTMNALPTQKLGAMPVVDLFYMYIDDKSVNDRSDPIMMGDWDKDKSGRPYSRNYWSYIVEPGMPKYPTKRLIVFTRKCVVYDGPSMYWHGMFPFVKFTPDPYPGLWYGVSPLWPCLGIQRSIDKIYRAIDDHIQKTLRPPVYGDKNSISDAELRKIDPRQQGQRWRQNPHGKGVQVAEIPPLDPIIEKHLDRLKDRMEDISGVKAITQAFGLSEAGQIPEGESIEKLMRFVSTQNRARSRQLERAQTEIGEMQTYNYTEFYDMKLRYQILGEDGVTMEDYDFDPDSIVPSYTNGDFKEPGVPDGDRVIDPRPRMDRARDHNKQFVLNVRPGTLMESAGQNRKMLFLLLRARGDMDLYSTLREVGIDNIGPEPPGTVYERIMAEKELIAEAAAQKAGGGTGGGSGSGPPPSPSGPPSGAPGQPPVSPGPTTPPGRPNTFAQPPHMEGNMDRTKLSTS